MPPIPNFTNQLVWMQYLPYILMTVFLGGAILWYMLVGRRSRVGSSGMAQSYQSSLKAFADAVGLRYTEVPKSNDRGVIQGGGVILSGAYQGHPIEVRFVHETREQSAGLTRSFVCSRDCGITVQGAGGGEWTIRPKDEHLVARPTGVEVFDMALAMVGPPGAVRTDQLETLGRYGWMHLEKRDGQIRFIDDFMDHIQVTKGSMRMLATTHPVWRTTATQWEVDISHAKAFLDRLVELAS
ncbi:MAG: hypothetical protein HY696_03040 [Deltaproteobacteria bacterium]|nr:hypothetical protein [Deltaproteobacteria bacterium]